MKPEPRVAIFTPTFRYGGLDVTYASLQRQTYRNFVWIIGDDLFDQRCKLVADRMLSDGTWWTHFKPAARKEGYHRNLAASYNEAMAYALEDECEIFVTLQDYIWAPADGLQRFVDIILEQDTLVTGMTSLTNDPTPDKVYNPEGLWTVFEEDYTEQPQDVFWWDVRATMHPVDRLDDCEPVHFETNWAAWPMWLYAAGHRFDEEYDKHVAFENQDWAWTCLIKERKTALIDPQNHSLGLPHKRYFPRDEEIDGPHSVINQHHHLKKWASPMVLMGKH